MRCNSQRHVQGVLWGALIAAALALAGCRREALSQSQVPDAREIPGVGVGYFDQRIQSFVVPPADWKLDPPKTSDRHTHLAWISPSGDTAYGVIWGRIPFWVPVALMSRRMLHNKVLEHVLIAMRQDQGEATLLSSRWDGGERKVLFEAEGGLYRIDCVLKVRGYSAWIVYVGRLRPQPINGPELKLGQRAREATRVGTEARAAAPAIDTCE